MLRAFARPCFAVPVDHRTGNVLTRYRVWDNEFKGALEFSRQFCAGWRLVVGDAMFLSAGILSAGRQYRKYSCQLHRERGWFGLLINKTRDDVAHAVRRSRFGHDLDRGKWSYSSTFQYDTWDSLRSSFEFDKPGYTFAAAQRYNRCSTTVKEVWEWGDNSRSTR